ncbi:Holliday junction resolvase-like protein [Pyrobaculum ferrireducens]|uniref:Holliday junction resolvase-like protein n=1 Tax=Pyrobaculum ferrireducens TaxID=1104324 RepID=UPI0011E4E617|nr:Holliday junction resolvase-like protein [Pyrobaculum ferrireducens]
MRGATETPRDTERSRHKSRRRSQKTLRQVEKTRRGEAESRAGDIEERYKTELERWRLEKEAEIREDAIRRSISTLLGRIGEQLAPLLMTQTLGVDPRDLRFLGTPVDYIAFKGLSQDNPQEILFIEVNSGKTTRLTEKQQAIKRLVEEKRVKWVTLHIADIADQLHRLVDREIQSQQTWYVDTY